SEDLTCVWWDKTVSSWKPDGCQTDVTSKPVKCLCNHLTSFSLQIAQKNSVVGDTPSQASTFPGKYVTYAGIGIGIGGFIFAAVVVTVIILIIMKRRGKKIEFHEIDLVESSSHSIPTNQIHLASEHLSSRCKMAKYQLVDVVLTKKEADGQSDLLLQRIRHVNIAQYLGCWINTIGEAYHVTSYVPGDHLSQWIKLGGYTDDMARQTVLQLANVMAHLVQQGVRDIDLTAEKIIMQPDERGSYSVKLWDFRSVSNLPPLYTAPEKKSGGVVTEASLVWAFGILALQIAERRLYLRESTYIRYTDGDESTITSIESFIAVSLQKSPKSRASFMELCQRGKEWSIRPKHVSSDFDDDFDEERQYNTKMA
ncbi:LATrophilin receptor family protein, partial [Planoprotostelium fungivorum]